MRHAGKARVDYASLAGEASEGSEDGAPLPKQKTGADSDQGTGSCLTGLDLDNTGCTQDRSHTPHSTLSWLPGKPCCGIRATLSASTAQRLLSPTSWRAGRSRPSKPNQSSAARAGAFCA